MAIEQRSYSCGEVDYTSPHGRVSRVPAFFDDPILGEYGKSFNTRMAEEQNDFVYVISAPSEAWDAFDAAYPNQDAQTGDPYRRRNTYKDMPVAPVVTE